MDVLQYSPGNIVTIILETLNYYYLRDDGNAIPLITNIIKPNGDYMPSYPQNMTHVTTGIWVYKFTLPSGSAAIGSYLALLEWTDSSLNVQQDTVQIICTTISGPFFATSR